MDRPGAMSGIMALRSHCTQRANWSDTSMARKQKSAIVGLRRFTIAFYAPASSSFLG